MIIFSFHNYTEKDLSTCCWGHCCWSEHFKCRSGPVPSFGKNSQASHFLVCKFTTLAWLERWPAPGPDLSFQQWPCLWPSYVLFQLYLTSVFWNWIFKCAVPPLFSSTIFHRIHSWRTVIGESSLLWRPRLGRIPFLELYGARVIFMHLCALHCVLVLRKLLRATDSTAISRACILHAPHCAQENNAHA
jgi:hypothetical protein